MRYVKKPIEVDAFELTGPALAVGAGLPDWAADAAREGRLQMEGARARVVTREGELTAYHGDWIIKGVQGEIYPCGADIFRATYEPAFAVNAQPKPRRLGAVMILMGEDRWPFAMEAILGRPRHERVTIPLFRYYPPPGAESDVGVDQEALSVSFTVIASAPLFLGLVNGPARAVDSLREAYLSPSPPPEARLLRAALLASMESPNVRA